MILTAVVQTPPLIHGEGLSKAEQMHVLASSGNDPNDSDIEFDKSEIRRYKKQARRWSAKSKKR